MVYMLERELEMLGRDGLTSGGEFDHLPTAAGNVRACG